MALRNLNFLVTEAESRFTSEFSLNGDFMLHQGFKDEYPIALGHSQSIRFFDYSAEITTSTSLKIHLPNQWFYIAAYMADYVSELLKYKNIFYNEIIKNRPSINKEVIQNQKNKPLNPNIETAINDYFENDEEKDFMKRFVCDYEWWRGSKTIDRGDFFASPVLNILRVVANTQGYIAEIANHYATNDTLKSEAIQLINTLRDERSGETTVINIDTPDETVTGAKNLILYGAPGTGKSYKLERMAQGNIIRVTFHSEYSYHDFVGIYKPVPIYSDESVMFRSADGLPVEMGQPHIDYQFVPGPFTIALENAFRNKSQMHTLMIEELNRANAAAVFGDIFQLLDRKENGESEYDITPSRDLYNYLKMRGTSLGNKIYIPSNLNIFATMNSADQGVFVMDSAFKRRWNFEYMPIQMTGIEHENELVMYERKQITWKVFVESINNRLADIKINEDKHIGPYFMKKGEPSDQHRVASKLLVYLWDDVVRHCRNQFFVDEIKTFAQLVKAYQSDKKIFVFEIEQQNSVVSEELDEGKGEEENPQTNASDKSNG